MTRRGAPAREAEMLDAEPSDLPDRFADKVDVHESGCWIWTGARNGSSERWDGGYPYYWLGGRMVGAHRYALELAVGVSVQGFDVHHTCGRRECVNPAHLEPMDRLDHMAETGVIPS